MEGKKEKRKKEVDNPHKVRQQQTAANFSLLSLSFFFSYLPKT
jgi:hypothetical protein